MDLVFGKRYSKMDNAVPKLETEMNRFMINSDDRLDDHHQVEIGVYTEFGIGANIL